LDRGIDGRADLLVVRDVEWNNGQALGFAGREIVERRNRANARDDVMSGGQGSFGDGAPETAGCSGDEDDVRHDSDLSLLTGCFS
jgi:hypothetical protein